MWSVILLAAIRRRRLNREIEMAQSRIRIDELAERLRHEMRTVVHTLVMNHGVNLQQTELINVMLRHNGFIDSYEIQLDFNNRLHYLIRLPVEDFHDFDNYQEELSRFLVACYNEARATMLVDEPQRANMTATEVQRRQAELVHNRLAAHVQPNTFGPIIDRIADMIEPAGTRFIEGGLRNEKASARAIELLEKHLSKVQLAQFKEHGSFLVVGCDTQRVYKIRSDKENFNVECVMNGDRWCFVPEGNCPMGDRLLAQKIALETDEIRTLTNIANFNAGSDGSHRRLEAMRRVRVELQGGGGGYGACAGGPGSITFTEVRGVGDFTVGSGASGGGCSGEPGQCSGGGIGVGTNGAGGADF